MILSAFHLVLMRPLEEGKKWQTQFASLGAQVDLLPMIEIVPVPVEKDAFTLLHNADKVIITSQQAIKYASPEMISLLKNPNLSIYTMGQSISDRLKSFDIHPVYVGGQGFQSEDLLEIEALQTVSDKNIVLLTGVGGRPVIAQTLSQRGANVACIHVYAQEYKKHHLDLWIEVWQRSERKLVFVVTSGNILKQWVNQVPTAYRSWLTQQRVLVISRRLEALAKEYGFQHIISAEGAHSPDITKALQGIVKVCHTSSIS